ncbi:MAG: hypothetical protein KF812_05290 [Fimbriimonadaceae bacterium]|nr:hypothetical protein [Fimbriimonadaceae bacterium]
MERGQVARREESVVSQIDALRQNRDRLLLDWTPQIHRVRRIGRRSPSPLDNGIASFILERAFLRLLSLCFLASTQKFQFGDRSDYPFALFDDWSARPGPYRFSQRLQLLYASAIHQPSGAARRLLYEQVGTVPYLSGGLFRPGAFERSDDADEFTPIPDEFFESLLGRDGVLRNLRFDLSGESASAVVPDDFGRLFHDSGRTPIEDPDADAVFVNDVGSGKVLVEGLKMPGRRLMADRLAHWVAATPSAIDAERARHWVALTIWSAEGLKAPIPQLMRVIRVGSSASPSPKEIESVEFMVDPTESDWIELARHVSAMANSEGGAVMLETLLGESEILAGLGRHVDPLTGSMFRLAAGGSGQWRIDVRPRRGCTYVLYSDRMGHGQAELCVRELGHTVTITDRQRDQFVLNRMEMGDPQ